MRFKELLQRKSTAKREAEREAELARRRYSEKLERGQAHAEREKEDLLRRANASLQADPRYRKIVDVLGDKQLHEALKHIWGNWEAAGRFEPTVYHPQVTESELRMRSSLETEEVRVPKYGRGMTVKKGDRPVVKFKYRGEGASHAPAPPIPAPIEYTKAELQEAVDEALKTGGVIGIVAERDKRGKPFTTTEVIINWNPRGGGRPPERERSVPFKKQLCVIVNHNFEKGQPILHLTEIEARKEDYPLNQQRFMRFNGVDELLDHLTDRIVQGHQLGNFYDVSRDFEERSVHKTPISKLWAL